MSTEMSKGPMPNERYEPFFVVIAVAFAADGLQVLVVAERGADMGFDARLKRLVVDHELVRMREGRLGAFGADAEKEEDGGHFKKQTPPKNSK